jgi:transposase
VGRVVAFLQQKNFTYAEMEAQSGIPSYLLKKAKLAYLRGDKKSLTAKKKVEGLNKISLEKRCPIPQAYVTGIMADRARARIQKLLEKGLTKEHIIHTLDVSNEVIYGHHQRMTVATYQKIMRAYKDLLYDAQMNIGTMKSANANRNHHVSQTKRKQQKEYLRPIKNYLKEHPDAMMKDVAAAVGITPHRLKMIDQNYHVLLPNTSRINLAKIRVKKTKAYLRQHPDAKTADIAKLLDVPKSTAYSILKRIEKKETKSNAT